MPTLSKSQLEIAAMLARGMSGADAARSGGVDPRTVRRWQKLEEFQQEVHDRRFGRKAAEQVHEAKKAARGGFSLDEAIAELREQKKAARMAVRATGFDMLGKFAARIQSIDPDDIAIKDLPTFGRIAHEFIQWAIASEAEELELDQLIEVKLGPDSLVAQRVEMEADQAVEKMFQAIALSPEIPAEHKQTFYGLLGGEG